MSPPLFLCTMYVVGLFLFQRLEKGRHFQASLFLKIEAIKMRLWRWRRPRWCRSSSSSFPPSSFGAEPSAKCISNGLCCLLPPPPLLLLCPTPCNLRLLFSILFLSVFLRLLWKEVHPIQNWIGAKCPMELYKFTSSRTIMDYWKRIIY